MTKKVARYKDCVVTREEICAVGADWKERMEQGLPAGEKQQVVSVIRKHEDFDEVLLPDDPLFQEAKKATWGGSREGAGRPVTGRKKQTFYATDAEAAKLKEYLWKLRTPAK
jgi:hypothetical protein